MAAILNPVRNVSTHFVQEQVESRRSPVVASSPGAGKPTSQPKTLKRIFRSSLQETIRNVTLAKKSREKISQESNDSCDNNNNRSEIEKTHTQRPQAPPPSAFTSHFHRPSIFRRSPGPENNNNSNGSIDIPSGASSGTSTPVHRRSADYNVNSHSLTIKSNDISPPSVEPHRPRVLRKHSNRVKTRASDSHHPPKNNSTAPSSTEGNHRLSGPSMPRHDQQRSDAENENVGGWSAFVAPSLSKASMSSPTLLQHIAENAKQGSDQVPPSSKTRSPLLSLGGLFPPARTRKLSIVEPPAPTLRSSSRKDSEKSPIAEKGELRKRVSSSILSSRLLSGTVKASGGDTPTHTKSFGTPSTPSAVASSQLKQLAPSSSSSSSSPSAVSRSKMATSGSPSVPSPPVVPPKSPSRLLRSQASASTSHLENLNKKKEDAPSSPTKEKEVKKGEKGNGIKEPSKSKISSRIIGMGHPSTMRKTPSASTSDLPSTATLHYSEDPSASSSPSTAKAAPPESFQPRRLSEDAPTIRASASSPSMSRQSPVSRTADGVSGRLSPRVRATTSTAASRARAASPSSISGNRSSNETARGGGVGGGVGGNGGGGHLVPRATSPSTGVKPRRASSSSVIRPALSPSPTPTSSPTRSSRLGRSGVGSVSTSHLPLEVRNPSPLPSSSSPIPGSSSSRPAHSHSASVPVAVSLTKKDEESKQRLSKLQLKTTELSPKRVQVQSRSVTSTPLPSSVSSVSPDSPSSPTVVTPKEKERGTSESTSNGLSGCNYVPSPQRITIRHAASALVKEVVHRKHVAGSSGSGSGIKTEMNNEEIDSRMGSLVRLERTWSTNIMTANGEEKERRYFGDALRDGYVLCQYINKVCPGSVIRIDSLTSTSEAKQLNISKFLAAVAAFGVSSDEIFDVEDLVAVPFTSDGLARVALTILAVKKLQDNPPPQKFQLRIETKQLSPSSLSSNINAGSPPVSPTTPKSPAAQGKNHNIYLSSNVGLASASTPNLPRPTSPIPIPVPAKRQRQVVPAAVSMSTQASVDVSSSAVADEEDVFGPVDSNIRTRPIVKLSTTSRTSMASTHTDTSVYSSLLDNRSTRYETIKSITTEATSLASETPSLTHTEGSMVKAALAKESPQQRIRRLSSPNSPVDEFPRRKDRRRSDSIDLSRVAEESEEGTIPTRRLGGNRNGNDSNGSPQPQRVIKLGQAKWPDDFMKVFDLDRDRASPIKQSSRESGETERGGCGGMVNLDDSVAKRKPSLVRSRRSLESTEPVIAPPSPSPVSRVRPRNSQHRVTTAAVAAELGSRVSPRSSLEYSPVRRPSQHSPVPVRTTLDGELSSPVPFPKTPSHSQLSTLPSSSETLLLPQTTKKSPSPTKVRLESEPLKDRRSSFGDNPNPRIPMRPRHESINVSPGESKAERSLIGGMDGSQVRKTLIVKEDGKPATHYQLGNCIGRGQFGTVYRALNLNTGQTVAVKRIRLEGLSEKEIKQLMHEVEIVKQLSHPSIVKYEGMARDPDTLSIVLEYAENGSLSQTLKAFGKLNESLVASFVTKVLEGLHYLHTSQVVHCDLKAANILTTKTGNVKLSDFGVSLNLRAMEQMNNDVAGTPNWMAPEVIELKGASPASDIWSLACTIIELLTGRPPYADIQNGMTVMFRIVEDSMPPLPEDLSDDLRDFLTLCFDKDPTKRPNAETLFEHPWLKNEWGMYKELRPQDSIPFLRRVSADLQRTDVRRLSFADDDRPNSPRSIPPSSPTFNSPVEAVFRPHEFVKSSFSQAVTCRICNQAVKKSVLFCKECSLIAHARCAADASDSCEPRGRMIRLSADVVRQHTPTSDLHSNSSPIQSGRTPVSPSTTPIGDASSSPGANDRFRLFGRKRSKASGMLSVSTEDLKATVSSSPPPVSFMNGAQKTTTRRIVRSPSQDNVQWQASIGGSDHSTSSRSVMTRSSRLSGSNRGSEYDPIPEMETTVPSSGTDDNTPGKPIQRSSRKGRQDGNSDKCVLQ